jgi:hypothetical protein
MVRYRFFLFSILLFPFPAYAAVNAAVDPVAGYVGTPLRYSLTIEDLPDVRAELPDEGFVYADDEKDIPLYEIRNAVRDSKRNMITLDIVYFKPGTYQLPLLPVLASDGTAVGYQIPQVEIAPVNPQFQLEPDELPMEAPGYPFRLILVILGSILLAFILFFLIRHILRRYRKTPELPAIPAIAQFRSRVDALDRRVGEISQESFADEMSAAFREFLCGQFGMNAEELTTEEIYVRLHSFGGDSPVARLAGAVEEVMRFWDIIRFAEAEFSSELLARNIDSARNCAESLAGGSR